jgi:hypothetical protein
MVIRSLLQHECDEYRAARTPMARRLTDTAVEWFACERGRAIGAIAYDERDLSWSAGILRRDDGGRFRALDRRLGLYDLDDARRLLVNAMTSIVASGTPIFPPSPRVGSR